ncbi:MAG: hypothetical protein D3911_11580 [Candidatus Electrothrix sp. AW3_4]|nr:hypothetical protein [Candidatus Electrothrix gigas]
MLYHDYGLISRKILESLKKATQADGAEDNTKNNTEDGRYKLYLSPFLLRYSLKLALSLYKRNYSVFCQSS